MRKQNRNYNLDERVDYILTNWKIDIRHAVFIRSVVETMEYFGLPMNSAFFSSSLLFDYELLPRLARSKTLASLLLCWDRFASLEEQSLLSTQFAGLVAALRRLGFVFKMDRPYQYVAINEKGEIGRQITALDKSVAESKRELKNCSKENIRLFRESGDPFTCGKKDLQADHRTPVQTCVMFGWQIPELNNFKIESGVAHTGFQIFDRNSNMQKNAACYKCRERNEDISIPPGYPREAYKRNRNDVIGGEESCEGCFWNNSALPMYPERYTLEEMQKSKMEQEILGVPKNLREKWLKLLEDGKVSVKDFWNYDIWMEKVVER